MERLLELPQHVGTMIGLAAEHHPIAPAQCGDRAPSVSDTAIDHHRQSRKRLFDPPDHVEAQRWNLAVVLGREATEDCLAGMEDGGGGAGVLHLPYEGVERSVVRVIEASDLASVTSALPDDDS